MIGPKRVKTAWNLLRHLGPGWIAYRLRYAIEKHTGWIEKRLPATSWDQHGLADVLSHDAISQNVASGKIVSDDQYAAFRREHAPAFFFSTSNRAAYASRLSAWDVEPSAVVEQCRAFHSGVMPLFSGQTAEVGFPPAWHENPLTHQRSPNDQHWSRIGDFDQGDIKLIWETGRFGFTYPLVRAYWRTGDSHYAELFWQTVESWHDENPPQQGVHWKCGQEASLRLMAWCFGLYGFADAVATTAQRIAMLARMIAVSAKRIETNIGYALSQKNNHGVSEGAGLFTAGLLFPELKGAERWKRRGRKVLRRLARELIYDDGSFSQHSFNYQRVMLHDYIWSARLAQLNGEPFEEETLSRIAKSSALLYQMQDRETGYVPCHGHNDGALVLPLGNCDYRDFRPVVQAAGLLTQQKRYFPPGPWDEDLLWLFGNDYENANIEGSPQIDSDYENASAESNPQKSFSADDGGYYTLRSDKGFVMIRCAKFRHRPSHADLLHVDLWWKGQNIALDAGTYAYNAAEPWNNSLVHTAVHNTITVDDQDQMEQAGRFLWLPWARGTEIGRWTHPSAALAYWEGQHDGYRRLQSPTDHRRGIARLGEEQWLVLDFLTSSGEHQYGLHWLFADVPYESDDRLSRLTLKTEAGDYQVQVGSIAGALQTSLIRADEQSTRGWQSPYYSEKQPALSLQSIQQAKTACFWTLFRSRASECNFPRPVV